jgi:hypothetical protein
MTYQVQRPYYPSATRGRQLDALSARLVAAYPMDRTDPRSIPLNSRTALRVQAIHRRIWDRQNPTEAQRDFERARVGLSSLRYG